MLVVNLAFGFVRLKIPVINKLKLAVSCLYLPSACALTHAQNANPKPPALSCAKLQLNLPSYSATPPSIMLSTFARSVVLSSHLSSPLATALVLGASHQLY